MRITTRKVKEGDIVQFQTRRGIRICVENHQGTKLFGRLARAHNKLRYDIFSSHVRGPAKKNFPYKIYDDSIRIPSYTFKYCHVIGKVV